MPDSAAFRVEVTATESGAVVLLSGEIDLDALESMQATTQRIVEMQPDTVSVDVAGVSFIDSSGLNALLNLRRRCGEVGASVTLINASRQVAALLEITGLSAYFGMSAVGDDIAP